MTDLPMLDPKPLLKKALRRREVAWEFYLFFLRRHDAAQATEQAENFRFWTEEVRVLNRLIRK